jgi:hypothetical protein
MEAFLNNGAIDRASDPRLHGAIHRAATADVKKEAHQLPFYGS